MIAWQQIIPIRRNVIMQILSIDFQRKNEKNEKCHADVFSSPSSANTFYHYRHFGYQEFCRGHQLSTEADASVGAKRYFSQIIEKTRKKFFKN